MYQQRNQPSLIESLIRALARNPKKKALIKSGPFPKEQTFSVIVFRA